MKTNYRQAIRNRCPRTVDLALKWCKAKDNWVEYIYETYFSFLKDNKSKNDQLDGIFKQFDFAKKYRMENVRQTRTLLLESGYGLDRMVHKNIATN